MSLTRKVPKWHEDLHTESVGKYPKLKESIQNGTSKYEEFGEFSNEVFSRLYSNDNIQKLKKVEHWRRWAKEAHEILDDLPEFKSLASRVRGNEMLTAAAASTMVSETDKRLPEPKDRIYDATDIKEQIEKLKRELKNSPHGPLLIDEEGKRQRLNQLQKQLSQNISNQTKIDPHSIRGPLKKSAQSAIDHVDNIVTAIRAVGKTPADLNAIDDEFSGLFMQFIMNNPLFMNIMEMAGRLNRVLIGLRAKNVHYARSEVVGITQGNDLSRVIPSELAMLELDEDTFLMKFAKGELLQYKLQGNEKEGKGPIVVCVDFSGSMGGQREVWSRAIALALMTQAREEARQFAACLFNHQVERQYDWESPPKDLLEFCSVASCGGTNFMSALDWASEMVVKGVGEKSDIIFITDGEDGVDLKYIEEFKRKIGDTRVLGIHIGGYHSTLSQFCDKIWNVSKLEDVVERLLLEVMKE